MDPPGLQLGLQLGTVAVGTNKVNAVHTGAYAAVRLERTRTNKYEQRGADLQKGASLISPSTRPNLANDQSSWGV